MKSVGIPGGMGPEATVLLMHRQIAATPARDDAGHVPLLADQNPPVPSRIRHLIEGTGDDSAPVLAAMVRRLQAAGAQALAMPRNTAQVPNVLNGFTFVPLADQLGDAWLGAAGANMKTTAKFLVKAGRIDAAVRIIRASSTPPSPRQPSKPSKPRKPSKPSKPSKLCALAKSGTRCFP